MAKIQIRYNHKSDGIIDKWQVLVDGTPFLFNELILDGAFDSEITMAEYGEMQHSITTLQGHILFKDGVAKITNMVKKKKFFIITGLPRSRTAWFAALMSSGRSICFHEPKSQFGSWENFIAYTKGLDYDYIGISDSSIAIDPDFKIADWQDAAMVVVLRDMEDAADSLADFLGLSITEATDIVSKITVGLAKWLDDGNVVIADYDSLNHESVIHGIWRVCLPDIPFEPARVAVFQKLLINQHIDKALAFMNQS